jgi:multidrug efflux pump subunit AcrA (membrane-fusion protein)
MKLALRAFYLLATAAIVWTGWYFLGSRAEISTSKIRKDTAVDAVPAVVKVDPEFQVTITSDVSGLVKVLAIKLGQQVKEGDLLFEIDDRDYRFELEKMTGELENLKKQNGLNFERESSLKRQKEDLANFERRAREGDYPELELKRRQDEFRIFVEQQEKDQLARDQQIANLEHSIELQKDLITKCRVLAPASGTVTTISAQPGEVVSVRGPLIKLYSESLLVEARINEEDFSGIRVGLDASVRFLAYGNELYSAKVAKVLPNADPQNQQYRAFLDVDMPAARLIPGLSGEASIIRNRRADTLVAPRSALYNGAIFVFKGDRVEQREVETGFRGLNVVEIRKGVEAGEIVATSGLEDLRDGQHVSVKK